MYIKEFPFGQNLFRYCWYLVEWYNYNLIVQNKPMREYFSQFLFGVFADRAIFYVSQILLDMNVYRGNGS